MILDPTSGLFYLLAVTAASGLTALALWHRHPQLRGLGLIAVGSLLTGPGLATLMVRSSHANTLHNVIVTAAAFAVVEGVLVFVGYRMALRLGILLTAATAVIWELILIFADTVYHPRIIAATLISVLIFGRGAILLHRLHPRRAIDAAERLLSGTLILHSGVLLARMATALLHPTPDFIHQPAFQGWFFLELIVTHVVLYYSVLMMVGNRLSRDLDQQGQALETERRHRQELHHAKQRAEEALAEKSRFLAATGHDLRQVTHAMKLLLASVDHELTTAPGPAGPTSASGRSSLTALVTDMTGLTDSMTRHLNALLDIARLDSGTLVPDLRATRLSDVLTRLSAQFSPMAEEADVDLRVILSSQTVYTDPGLLLRILGNLVDNAIRFGQGGRVIVGCRRRGGSLLLEVWDQGPGIEADQQELIFQEYRQIDNPNRDRQKGLGLGLSIARRTAALLSMHVTVQSSPGQYTRFTVELPRQNK